MVFDGVCNFCSTSVRLVTFMARSGVIRFAPIQSALGQALCRQEGVDPNDPATFLFFDRGHALRSSDAMAALLARLPRPWRWLRVMKFIPWSAREVVYLWVARHRYRLFGKRRVCMIPSPGLRARFADLAPSPE
jgi:predicted DCC family thiol-disulfide oxidoreductase YuxK